MEWIYVSVILSSAIMMFWIVANYKKSRDEVQDRIEYLANRISLLENAVSSQTDTQENIKTEQQSTKGKLEELKREIRDTEMKLKAARDLELKISMEMYKKEFKRGKR